ncbi:GntR family transcriptional regulator [Actinomyces sp. oral taxon 170]|jgi:transcriptional regulator, gntR family protein|uniref:GntR family transcriptional regulator n=1 Tax=Actinomyces sp. oral taxon 170 TaxID=712117 RepID=UPI000205C7E4|nr:GntR family transcriptional regulator [Actinomyces sp. oral taxon 170]EGF50608.1 transcriptional regulator, GntR family [Actinomyces sp. oral taxon 170 str. F0386]
MSRHFEDSTPIYLQIAEEVRTQILSGDLSDGDRLTSTTEYATQYRINPATANKAITLLVDEGLAVKRRGIGMFVAHGAYERLRDERARTYVDTTLGPALHTGRVLGLSDDDLVEAARTYLRNSPVNPFKEPA